MSPACCKLVATSEERSRSLIYQSAHVIWNYHITKQFRVFTIVNKVQFMIIFLGKMVVYRSATKNNINTWKFHVNRHKNVFGTSCSNLVPIHTDLSYVMKSP